MVIGRKRRANGSSTKRELDFLHQIKKVHFTITWFAAFPVFFPVKVAGTFKQKLELRSRLGRGVNNLIVSEIPGRCHGCTLHF